MSRTKDSGSNGGSTTTTLSASCLLDHGRAASLFHGRSRGLRDCSRISRTNAEAVGRT